VDETAAVRGNGSKVKRVVSDDGDDGLPPLRRAAPPTGPSPISEPGKAAAAARSTASEVHKALAVNDAERMAAARVLGAELTAIVRDAARTILAAQGMAIDEARLDAILSERVTAGVRVVKAKHGNVVRPRKLPRVVAIAYGLGGSVASAYERLAAIQTAWPFVFALASTVAHTVAIAKGIGEGAVAVPKAPPIEVVPQEPSIVDAREIA